MYFRLAFALQLGLTCIRMYGRMPGKDRSIVSVSIGDKAGQGNWWHAFNIRIQRFVDETGGGQPRTISRVDYGVVNLVYNGPAVATWEYGIGGNPQEFKYRPLMTEMMEDEEWKMGGKIIDPRTVRPTSGVDGYRTLMFYESEFQGVSRRICEMISYVEIRALDALTNSYLPNAKYVMNGRGEPIETFQYRLIRDPTGGFIGGYPVRQGVHVFELTRSGYQTLTFTLQIPIVCEGSNCLSSEYVYHEVYMIPSDGKTRFILNWGDVPGDLDIIVMPVGVQGLTGEPMNISWKTGKGEDVQVYGYDDIFPATSEYGPGREPYASWLLGDTRCACEYTCRENDLTHPFVCTHYISDARERCIDYESNNGLEPFSRVGQAPMCYDRNGIAKAACCCNDPDENGLVTCKGESDAWCCPVAQEVAGSMCSPVCSMHTSAVLNFNTTISIDRDEASHNDVAPDTDGKFVNRPEVATLSNLLPGTYRLYANAYSPSFDEDKRTFGSYTSMGIYLGNGEDLSVLVDTVTITRGAGKWIYGGYLQVTATQDSCFAPTKMMQKNPVNGRYLCYSWYSTGYSVSSPLALQYSALHVRIAGASGRQDAVLPDFTGAQYSVHAGGTCSCSTTGANRGCRCSGGSALVHAGVLGPMQRTQEDAEGWAKTTNAIYFPVESGQHYWLIVTGGGYYDHVYSLGACYPYVWGPIKTQSVVMVKKVDAGELRVIFGWSKISDGDVFIFKDPIPIHNELRRRAGNEPFVYWDDTQALPGVRLEQDCTTKECGVETVFFSNSAVHNGATYTVAVGVYAGLDQDSSDGKCEVSPVCNLQGRNSGRDERVDFYASSGLVEKVEYVGR